MNDVIFIDNLFLDANFDSYTVTFYLLLLYAVKTGKSPRQCMPKSAEPKCKKLLLYCNIIKINKSKIVLVDKSEWNLDHRFRSAQKFYKCRINHRQENAY